VRLKFDIKKTRSRNLNYMLIFFYTVFMISIFLVLKLNFSRLNVITDNFYNLYKLQAEVNTLVEDINILFNNPDVYFESQDIYPVISQQINKVNSSFVELKKSARRNKKFLPVIEKLEDDYRNFSELYARIVKINRELYHPTEGLYVLIRNIEGELRNNNVFKVSPYKDMTDELFMYIDDLEKNKIDIKIFHQKAKYFQDRIRNLKVSGQSQELTKYQYQTLIFNYLKLIDRKNVITEVYGHPYDKGLFLKIHKVKELIKQHFSEVYVKSYNLINHDQKIIIYVFLLLEFIAMVVMLIGFYFIYLYVIKPVNFLEKYIRNLASTEKLEYLEVGHNLPLEISNIVVALNKHISHLKTKTVFVDKIRQEKHDFKFTLVSESDELGKSLEQLRLYLMKNKEEARKIREAEDKQRWITQGLASLGTLMRQNVNDLDSLLYSTLKGILDYVQVPIGAIYLKAVEGETEYYYLKTAIAYGNKRVKDLRFLPNESFVGTVAVEEKTMVVDKLPPDYIFFESAFGYAKPSSVAYVPLKSEDGILGVLEVATNKDFEEHILQFLESVSKDLASTIVYVRINEKTKSLAEDFQKQISEFKQKEEQHLKQIQELEEKLRKAEQELEEKKRLMFNKEDIIKEKIQEIIKLKDQLFVKDKEIEQIQKDFEKVEAQLKKHISNLEEQINKLIEDLNECNKKNKDK